MTFFFVCLTLGFFFLALDFESDVRKLRDMDKRAEDVTRRVEESLRLSNRDLKRVRRILEKHRETIVHQNGRFQRVKAIVGIDDANKPYTRDELRVAMREVDSTLTDAELEAAVTDLMRRQSQRSK